MMRTESVEPGPPLRTPASASLALSGLVGVEEERARLREVLGSWVAPQVLEQAAAEGWAGRPPLELLVERGHLTTLQALEALARLHGLPVASLRRCHPARAALALVSHDLARRCGVLPLVVLPGELLVATARPDDLDARDFLAHAVAMRVRPVVVLQGELDEAMRRCYLVRGTAEQAMEQITADRVAGGQSERTLLPVENEDAPAIRLVSYVLSHAIDLGASDVHFEPFATQIALRCRVDGILHELPSLPVDLYRAVVSRIKVLAGLDIAEKRLPQDGRFTFEAGQRAADLRVSVIPGVHGESVVARVLDTPSSRQQLHELGLDAAMQARWEHLVAQPHGLVLVTGPTGSGKSTTLYTTLRHMASPRRKLVTLEDPVECHLPGVSQFQIQPAIGFGFAEGLRALLRHDPDVIMLGEIRDTESAEIALRASLTGHLLFSTLHTNNALLAVTRLMDMGLPSFLVLASLSGCVAQRLVRRLCPVCKVAVPPPLAGLRALGVPALPVGGTLYEARGCTACGQLGYRGRVAVYELLEMTPRMRQLPVDRLFFDALHSEALRAGYVPLRQAVLRLLFEGVTSLEEVLALGAGGEPEVGEGGASIPHDRQL